MEFVLNFRPVLYNAGKSGGFHFGFIWRKLFHGKVFVDLYKSCM
jgi:hypothetical protein